MKCPICRNGSLVPGKITVVLEKGKTTLVFREVPAEVCDNCGEEYVDGQINSALLERANEAAQKGVDLELLRYAA
jgi:YgiT-type zinc finger domain-containing protein